MSNKRKNRKFKIKNKEDRRKKEKKRKVNKKKEERKRIDKEEKINIKSKLLNHPQTRSMTEITDKEPGQHPDQGFLNQLLLHQSYHSKRYHRPPTNRWAFLDLLNLTIQSMAA